MELKKEAKHQSDWKRRRSACRWCEKSSWVRTASVPS